MLAGAAAAAPLGLPKSEDAGEREPLADADAIDLESLVVVLLLELFLVAAMSSSAVSRPSPLRSRSKNCVKALRSHSYKPICPSPFVSLTR